MMTDVQTLLGGMSVTTFLHEYWQQKPLLVRQAFPDFDPIISPDELAGLACETDKARIIIEQGGKTPWEVRHGPFNERSFKRLPKTHWTLLVNDTEQLVPELFKIIQPFRFLPDWRIDDLMISFAVEGGSVGPHIDEYDVFLIQGYGQRHWQINEKITTPHELIPDLELRILQHFNPTQAWTLEPGDMLYLPPNVAHYGVALADCMTYSVGFRASNAAELLEEWMQTVLADSHSMQRYHDKQRPIQDHAGELLEHDLAHLRQLVRGALADDHYLNQWLGAYLSKSKHTISEIDLDTFISEIVPNDIKNNLTNSIIIKNTDVRFIFFIKGQNLHCFVNGQAFQLLPAQLAFVQCLADLLPETALDIGEYLSPINKNSSTLQPLTEYQLKNAQFVEQLLTLGFLSQ